MRQNSKSACSSKPSAKCIPGIVEAEIISQKLRRLSTKLTALGYLLGRKVEDHGEIEFDEARLGFGALIEDLGNEVKAEAERLELQIFGSKVRLVQSSAEAK